MIYVLYSVFFSGFLKNKCPGVGVIVRFFCPRGRALALSLRPGNGEFAISNKFPGGSPGGMVRLEID